MCVCVWGGGGGGGGGGVFYEFASLITEESVVHRLSHEAADLRQMLIRGTVPHWYRSRRVPSQSHTVRWVVVGQSAPTEPICNPLKTSALAQPAKGSE